jgi:hypothetical protein
MVCQSPPPPLDGSKPPILKQLYIVTSALSIMMVFWILISPSSWLVGRSQLHDAILFHFIDPHGPTPPQVFQKYAGHTAVHLTHILPGAIWAGLVPIQLHPTLRKTRPRLHRLSGYVFILTSLSMGAGVFLILQRDLLFENYFDVVDDKTPDMFPSKCFLGLFAVYFMGTALAALHSARDRRFAAHQKWIIRHIASGIWIAVQRVLLSTVVQALYYSSASRPVSPETQKHIFKSMGILATWVCLAVGEYVVYLLEQSPTKSFPAKQVKKEV